MAVAFDNVASGSSITAGAPSLTWTHNVAAGANLLLVCVSLDELNNAPAAGYVTVTAGGVSMVQSTGSPVSNAAAAGLWIFQLFNPPTGSSVSIVATNAGGTSTSNIDAFIGGSLSFTGASTLGTPVALASQTGAAISSTVTGVAATSVVAAFCSAGDNINTPSPGTSRYLVNAKGSGGNTDGNSAGATNTGTGSVVITWGGMPAGDSNNSWGVEVQGGAAAAQPAAVRAVQLPPGWFPGAGGSAMHPGGIPFYFQLSPGTISAATITATGAAAGAGSAAAGATQGAIAIAAGAGSAAALVAQQAPAAAAGAGAATAVVTQGAIAAAAGAGSVTAAVRQAVTGAAAGAGSVAAAGSVLGLSTGAAAGAGSVTAVVTQAVAGAAAGAGAEITAVTQAVTGAAAGAGSVTAAATVISAAAAAGAGSAAALVMQAVTGPAAGAGAVTAVVRQTVIAAAAGAGAVTAASASAALTPVQVTPVASVNVSGSGTATLTFGSAVTPGNTVVVLFGSGQTTTNPVISGITLGGNADHFASAKSLNNNTDYDAEIWYDPNVGVSGATSVVVSFSGGTGGTVAEYAVAYEIPSILAADQVQGQAGSASGTWDSLATGTTGYANEIFFGSVQDHALPAITGTGIWTSVAGTFTSGSFWAGGYQVVFSAGTADFSGTVSGTQGFTAVVAAFRAVVTSTATATAAGTGSATAAAVQIAPASAAGAGSATAAVTQAAAASAAGAGAATTATTVIAGAAAAGAGSVTGVAAEQVTAPAAGAGAITAVVTQAAIAAAAGAGAAAAAATQAVTAAAAGAGSATAAVTQAAIATAAGAGSAAAAATVIALPVQLPGSTVQLPPGWFPGAGGVATSPGGIPFQVSPVPGPAPPAPAYITGLDPATGMFFTDQYGRPRLMAVDNPWALICNAGEWTSGNWQSEMSAYLTSRSAQGFTGLYVAALGCTDIGGTFDNGNTWDSVPPFVSGGDPSTGLNSTYWARVDYLITTAAALGLTVFLNIAYTQQVGGGNLESGGALYNLTQAQYTAYGTAIGNRYKSQPNIVWMYGNDYFSGVYDTAFGYIRSAILATGDTHAMSVHVYPESTSRYDIETSSGGSSGSAFSTSYAQVNWVYTYNVTYFGIELAYGEAALHSIPQLPAAWGDGYFYDSGASLPTDQMTRQMAWWAVASGARGFNSGSNDIWPWASGSPAAVTTGLWWTAEARILTSAVQALPGWHLLLPDTSSTLVTGGRGTHGSGISTGSNYNGGTDNYVAASRTPDTGAGSSLAVIYGAKAYSITINQAHMVTGYTATWLDPTNGATTAATAGSTYNSGALGNNSQGEPDWVLILQGAASTTASGTAAAAGAGSVTAVVTQAVIATAAGAGSAAAAVTVISAAAAAGAGAATAVARQAAIASAAGAGSVTAAGSVTGQSTAAAAGAGSVTAAVTQIVTAAAAGAGAATALAVQSAIAAAAGAGAATAVVTQVTTAATAGAGAVTATGTAPGVTYRLMDGVSGRPGTGSSGTQPPSAGTSYSGNYIAGIAFEVTSFGLWFQGYWWWVPNTVSQVTAGQKFALWQVTGSGAGTFVPNSTVTAGTLTAGAWNYVPLATPLALTAGVAYNAATGYVSTSGFPKTASQFAATQPYAAGITNGPLAAYSSSTGSNTVGGLNWLPQEPYSTGGSDPGVVMPTLNDADDLLWLDVQVSGTAPSGASYRAFPDMPVASMAGGGPQSLAYTLGMEFSLSQSCTLSKIWHYSAPTSTVLPTRCGIWNVGTTTEVSGSDNSSPAWLLPAGGAASAGAGWVWCDYSSAGVTLAAGTNYKVSTFTSDNTHVWFGTTTHYWDTGPGAAGITTGPLSLPDNAAASPGQNSWNLGVTWTYPGTSSSPENDWVDVEVIPAGSVTGTAAAAGAGSVTAAATVIAGAAAAGTGSAAALAVQVVTATAAGAGAATAAAAQAAAGAAAGAGSVTDVATVIARSAAAGAGSVTAVAAQAVTGSAAGAGTVTAAVTQAVTAAAAGAGAATATGSVAGQTTGAAAGAGSVTAAAAQQALAAAAGAGSAAAVITQQATATAAGAGAVSTAVTQGAAAAAAGAGSVAAAGSVQGLSTGAAAGAGSVSALTVQAAPGTAAGAGAASGVSVQAVIASAAGAGSVTAAGTVQGGPATAAASGAGAASGVATQGAVATAAGTGTASASGYITGTASAAGAGSASAGIVQAAGAQAAGTGTAQARAVQIVIAMAAGSGAVTAYALLITPVPFTGEWDAHPLHARWQAVPLPGRWHASPLPSRWRILMSPFDPISSLSVEELPIHWTTELAGTEVDPTGVTAGSTLLVVQFAVPVSSGNPLEPAQPSTWYTGSWLTGTNIAGYVELAVVGPPGLGGAVQLSPGMSYDVFGKILGTPIQPVKYAGTISVF